MKTQRPRRMSGLLGLAQKRTKRRRTEIRIETRRTIVVRRRPAVSCSCTGCDEQVAMFTPEGAARLLRTTPRFVYRLIESGEVHFIESPDGLVLVCLKSLGT